MPIDCREGFPAQRSLGDIRLVAGRHQKQPCLIQKPEGFRHTGKDDNFLHIPRRKWPAVSDQASIQNPVAIQKNRSACHRTSSKSGIRSQESGVSEHDFV
jgi:hypothetical protein